MLRTAVALVLASLLAAPLAQAGEVEEAARTLFEKHRNAVVTAQLVVKQTMSMVGQGSNEDEQKREATATIISPEGLAVMSLAETDPSAIFEDMMGGAAGQMTMDFQVTDVKYLMADGREIPARVVLRDKDLDLAYLLPLEKPAEALPHIDLSDSAKVGLLDQIVTINRLGRVANRAHSVSIERVEAIVERPRTFYLPGTQATNTGMGSPAFALDGKLVGVFVMRSVRSTGGGGGGFFSGGMENVTAIILPAADVAEGAAQAPSFDEPAIEEGGEAPPAEDGAAEDTPPQDMPAEDAPAA